MTFYIRMDFAAVMVKSWQMQMKAMELLYQIHRLNIEKENLRRSWESPASAVMQQKLEQQIEMLNRTRKRMVETVELIQITARAIQRADSEIEKKAGQL